MKRIFALLLALVMIVGLLPAMSFAAEANAPAADGNPMRMWYTDPAPLTGTGYNNGRNDTSWWQEETLPLGNGTLFIGAVKALEHLLESGCIDHMPKIIAIQSEKAFFINLQNTFTAHIAQNSEFSHCGAGIINGKISDGYIFASVKKNRRHFAVNNQCCTVAVNYYFSWSVLCRTHEGSFPQSLHFFQLSSSVD